MIDKMDLKYEIPDNSICVDGKFYQLSGWQKIDEPINWDYTRGNIVWMTTLRMPNPYPPPEGYMFSYSNVLDSNGFTVVQNGSGYGDSTAIRILNFLNNWAQLSGVRWTLVPKPPEED